MSSFSNKVASGDVRWYHNAADFANIFKAFIGTNYLSLSYGFSQAGLVFGLIGLLIVSILTNHCCKLIVKCKHHLVDEICSKYETENYSNDDVDVTEMAMLKKRLQRNMDYADIGRLVFGKWGARVVNLFIVITQIGFCVGYVVFVGNMLHGFFSEHKVKIHTILHNSSEVSNENIIHPQKIIIHKRMVDEPVPNFSDNYSYVNKYENGNRNENTQFVISSITNISGSAINDLPSHNNQTADLTEAQMDKQVRTSNLSTTKKFIADHNSSQFSVSSTTILPSEAITENIPSETTENHFEIPSLASTMDPDLGNISNMVDITNSTHKLHQPFLGPSLSLLCMVSLPLFILFTFFRSVRQLGIISVLANVSILIGFVSVLGYIVIDLHISESFSLFIFATLPVYVAQVIGAYEAIGTIIPIEASMEDNSHNFSMSINIVVIVFTCLIGVLASFGYLQFGTETKQIIAQNLPADNPVVILINITLIFGVLCTYPLQIFPVVEIFEGFIFTEGACCGPPTTHKALDLEETEDELSKTSLLPSNEPQIRLPIAAVVPKSVPTWKRNLFRIFVAVFVCGLGVFLRNVFAYVGALVGAIGSCPLAFILPCMFHIKLMRGKVSTAIVVKDVLIISFGIVCGVIGSLVTLEQIIYRL